MKKIKKGSMTIEAACLMFLVLLVIMSCVYLFFFVHNRAWLTAAAYEAAIDGSMEGIKKNGKPVEVARKKCEELGNTGFFTAENLNGQVSGQKNIQVVYDLDTDKGFGGFDWHIRAKGKTAVIKPVSWIRKAKAVSEMVKGATDG